MKKFKRWLNYNPPKSATGEEWAYFRRDFKENAPIRFKIRELRLWGISLYTKYITESIKWVKFRTIKKHHIIKTDLDPGYHTISTRILHASFSLLVTYVNSRGLKNVDDEVIELYRWWAEIRPNRVKLKRTPLPKGDMGVFSSFTKEYKEKYAVELKRFYQEAYDVDTQHELFGNEDTEKLIELMKIRRNLW